MLREFIMNVTNLQQKSKRELQKFPFNSQISKYKEMIFCQVFRFPFFKTKVHSETHQFTQNILLFWLLQCSAINITI